MNGFATNPLALIGHVVISFLAQTGRLFQFIVASLAQLISPPVFIGLVIRQIMAIGYNSLPVVGLTAYAADEALALAGRHSGQSEAILGYRGREELIHRDDMVLL